MKLNEFFNNLDVTEAPKRFPEGHYTHTPGTLEVMPTQDKTLWADAGELPKKFNVTKMKIAIYDEQDDQDPYSYGNGGLIVYHNAGTWKMYTDDVTRVQIADYLGIANKDIDFSEQGMQDEEYMHFDIEDDAVAQLIDKGSFKLEENVDEANNLEDRAEKMVLAKLMKEYKGYESMVANARGRDDKRMYKDRLRDLGQMIKYVQGKTPFGIDTILEEEVAEMIEKAMAKLKGKGVKEDEGSDKEKWLRYAKFWKYIRDIMAQEADADIADGFISADNIDEEPSYVTAKEMMQTAMAKQNTPWNDAIINSDLEEYRHQLSDNDNYTEKTNFGKMKKAAIEMITTGKTQIVPYRGYPPMDQMDYSAEDTTDEDINDIVRLSGIK